MRVNTFHIPGSLWVERSLRKDGPSPVYVAWVPHKSMLFYDTASLLKFCRWPKSTATGQAFREWLAQFDDDSVVAELEKEPQEQTRTVI